MDSLSTRRNGLLDYSSDDPFDGLVLSGLGAQLGIEPPAPTAAVMPYTPPPPATLVQAWRDLPSDEKIVIALLAAGLAFSIGWAVLGPKAVAAAAAAI